MSSTLVFQRPKNGAVRDVRELEYISALHQSETVATNPHGLICAGCVTALVRSRHGVVLPIEHVYEQILPDLAGVPSPKLTMEFATTNQNPKTDTDADLGSLGIENGIENDGPKDDATEPCKAVHMGVFLDIANLVSMLMIPKFKRHAEALSGKNSPESYSDDDRKEAERFFGSVLGIFRRDMGLDIDNYDGLDNHTDNDNNEPLILTRELLQTMLKAYGEDPNNEEAVDEMMDHIAGVADDESAGPPRLDMATLVRALSSDLEAYNTQWETSKTTHSDDFLGLVDGGIGSLLKGVDCQKCMVKHGRTVAIPADMEESQEESTNTVLLKRLSDNETLSVLDLAADTFNSHFYFVLLFLSMILIYLSFDKGVNNYINLEGYFDCRAAGKNYFGCEVAEAIANWLFIFLRLGVFGTFYMMVSSAGNFSMKACGFPKNILACVIIIVITILPFFIPSFNVISANAGYLEYAPHAVLAVGIFLLSYQFISMGKMCSPRLDAWCKTNSLIVKKELASKRAQRNKVDKMVCHALELHGIVEGVGRGDEEGNTGKIARDSTWKTVSLSETRRSTVAATASVVAVRNYQRWNNEVETVGGWWWGLRRALGRWDDEGEEGIWLGARLLASFCGQWIAALLFISLFAFSITWVGNLYVDSANESGSTAVALVYGMRRAVYFNTSGGFLLSNDLAQPDYLESNGLEFAYEFEELEDSDMYKVSSKENFLRSVLNAVSTAQQAATVLGIEDAEGLIDNLVESVKNSTGIDLELLFLYAERYVEYDGTLVAFIYDEAKKRVPQNEILPAVVFGGVMGMIAILANTLVFIPSYVCQCLKYRCGALARNPLHSRRFQNQKKMLWEASSLFGMVFWSTLVSGVLVAGVLGGALFLFIWSETSKYFLALLAAAIGITTTWILKVIVLQTLKNRTYSGFYRKNVGLANGVTIFIEVRNLVLFVCSF